MSETPQGKIEAWRAEGHWVKEVDEPERGIREAIRAVLAEIANLRGESERLAKVLAERDALRALLHQSREVEGGAQTRVLDLEAERDTLREIMRRLVHGIDEWNASVEPIIGRPVDYKWLALEEARDVLAPEGKP